MSIVEIRVLALKGYLQNEMVGALSARAGLGDTALAMGDRRLLKYARVVLKGRATKKKEKDENTVFKAGDQVFICRPVSLVPLKLELPIRRLTW